MTMPAMDVAVPINADDAATCAGQAQSASSRRAGNQRVCVGCPGDRQQQRYQQDEYNNGDNKLDNKTFHGFLLFCLYVIHLPS